MKENKLVGLMVEWMVEWMVELMVALKVGTMDELMAALLAERKVELSAVHLVVLTVASMGALWVGLRVA